ncbi:MAG: hypothetical protein LBK06_05755 [Planctomycetaceae bacterium]|jgi:hypothetical protein|nr:hypothetical protein [Planctomycetaceae bacterium]
MKTIPSNLENTLDLENTDISPDRVYSVKVSDEQALSDNAYVTESKRHRNRIARLDHWFDYLTHNVGVFSIAILFGGLTLITRCVAVGLELEWVKRLSDDLWTVFSFLFGALVAYLLTKVLDKKKTEQQQQEN